MFRNRGWNTGAGKDEPQIATVTPKNHVTKQNPIRPKRTKPVRRDWLVLHLLYIGLRRQLFSISTYSISPFLSVLHVNSPVSLSSYSYFSVVIQFPSACL